MPKYLITLLLESYVIFVFKSGHYLDIKYEKCLKKYCMQKYASSDISALAVRFSTICCMLETNKKHKSDRIAHQIPHVLAAQTLN